MLDVRRKQRRKFQRVHRDQVIWHDTGEVVEPEDGQLVEHLPLVRDPRTEHVIERRDPIRGNDQELILDLVDVAYLAATEEAKLWKGGF
jgi:hypothetical protein